MYATEYQVELLREEVKKYTETIIALTLRSFFDQEKSDSDILDMAGGLIEACREGARHTVDARH